MWWRHYYVITSAGDNLIQLMHVSLLAFNHDFVQNYFFFVSYFEVSNFTFVYIFQIEICSASPPDPLSTKSDALHPSRSQKVNIKIKLQNRSNCKRIILQMDHIIWFIFQFRCNGIFLLITIWTIFRSWRHHQASRCSNTNWRCWYSPNPRPNSWLSCSRSVLTSHRFKGSGWRSCVVPKVKFWNGK